jgi:hypothetical protein
MDNYYLASGNGSARECDADHDGWVSDSAQPAIEGDNAILRANAHCHVRRIAHIVLENEQGATLTAPDADFTTVYPGDPAKGIPAGLPLYESARNDGAPSSTPPPGYDSDAGRAFTPAELNSFTRACATSSADYNDNGISDVDEWGGMPLDITKFPNTRLHDYYVDYTRFSYFVELDDGWVERASGGTSVDEFRIRERSRLPRTTGLGVSVGYVYDPTSPVQAVDQAYTQVCARHIDALFVSDGGAPPGNTIGGDFARYGEAWGGMTHASQFKCAHVVNRSDYQQAANGSPATEEAMPQVVYALATDGGAGAPTVARVPVATANLSMPLPNEYFWTINDCLPADVSQAGTAPVSADILTSTFPSMSCVTSTPQLGTVRWAAVGYTKYSIPTTAGYQRGCVDQCIEQPNLTAQTCQQCETDAYGEGSSVPFVNGPDSQNPCWTDSCDPTTGQVTPKPRMCPLNSSNRQTACCVNKQKNIPSVCDGSGSCGECDPNAPISSNGCGGNVSCSPTGQCGNCIEGASRCNEASTAVETCSGGAWTTVTPACPSGFCYESQCAECKPGDEKCDAAQTNLLQCQPNGTWSVSADCSMLSSGATAGICALGYNTVGTGGYSCYPECDTRQDGYRQSDYNTVEFCEAEIGYYGAWIPLPGRCYYAGSICMGGVNVRSCPGNFCSADNHGYCAPGVLVDTGNNATVFSCTNPRLPYCTTGPDPNPNDPPSEPAGTVYCSAAP